MSSHSSDGALRLRIGDALRENARRNPSMRVTATSIGQQLGADPELVAPILVEFARERLLQPILIERCDEGHIASGVLGDGNQPEEAYCNGCEARATFRPYVLYGFTGDLIAEAGLPRPKVLRRKAPLLSTLGKILVRLRPFPARIETRKS
jgi:hypothetical protein